MFEFRGRDPQGFFFSSFVFSPLGEVLQLAFVLLVELGVKDFGDLVFGFTVNVDWRQRWLDVVWDGVWSCWFEDRNMKDRVDRSEGIRELKGKGMSASLSDDVVGTKVLLRELL